MEAFPAFFPLAGRRVVIAGEGEGADAKARLLATSPATVERIAGAAALEAASYAGAALAFVAHPDVGFCEGAAAAARAAGAAVNVVDHPALCDFHTPAIIDRGQVVVAIGTAGSAPMVAALLRADLEARIPESLGPLSALFGDMRAELRAAFPDLARRRAFLRGVLEGPVAEAAARGELDEAARALRTAIAAGVEMQGRIWLIARPPSRDLLTLRAARALAETDVLVLDDPADREIAVLARRDAIWRALADTDGAFLAREAADGRLVAVVALPEALAPFAAALGALGARFEPVASA